jgi:hypothetical protein
MTAKTPLKYHERCDVAGKPAFNATDTFQPGERKGLCLTVDLAIQECPFE